MKGVQTASNIRIYNKNQEGYSDIAYDIAGATANGVTYPSIDPSIFEVKYPDADIEGKITSY